MDTVNNIPTVEPSKDGNAFSTGSRDLAEDALLVATGAGAGALSGAAVGLSKFNLAPEFPPDLMSPISEAEQLRLDSLSKAARLAAMTPEAQAAVAGVVISDMITGALCGAAIVGSSILILKTGATYTPEEIQAVLQVIH